MVSPPRHNTGGYSSLSKGKGPRQGGPVLPWCLPASVFYGWPIAAVCGYQYFLSGPGQTYGVSQFLASYADAFDVSPSTLSLLYAIATASSGFSLPLMGRVVDSWGVKRVSLVVSLAFAAVCFFNAWLLRGPVTLLVSFYAVRFLGQGCMTLLPKSLLPQWFVAKRGRAFAVVNIGSFGGSTLFPILLTWLIGSVGWRRTWVVLAFILLVSFVPLVMFVMVESPEQIGLLPDGTPMPYHEREPSTEMLLGSGAGVGTGESAAAVVSGGGGGSDTGHEDLGGYEDDDYVLPPGFEISWTRGQAMKTRSFYLLLACNGQRAAVNTALTFFLHLLLTERGMTDIQAALVLSIQAAVGFPMTLVAGYLADRIPLHYIMAATYLVQALFLTLIAYASTLGLAVVAAILWGIAGGLEQIVFNVVWPNYYGRKYVASIVSISISCMVLGSAVGPLLFSMLHRSAGSFRDAILYLVPLSLLCTALAYMATKPRITDSGLHPLDFYDDDLFVRRRASDDDTFVGQNSLLTDDSLEEVD